MLTVNEASQAIAAAVKSGWKLGSTTAAEADWSETRVNKAMEPVEGALSTLRSVYREQGNLAKIVDVERAALGVVSKLNSLQMVCKQVYVSCCADNLIAQACAWCTR
jgi:hypothetical protein